MTGFRSFSSLPWEIFFGNALMLVTILSYIAWWTVSFRPNEDNNFTGANLFLTITLLAGLAAIVILLIGMQLLFLAGKRNQVLYILAGALVFYLVFLAVTKIVLQRTVTAELLLIVVWTALEISVITVLSDSGRLSLQMVRTLSTLVGLAAVIGVVCYSLHYRLDNETHRFWNGLIPLIMDAGIVSVISGAILWK